MDWISWGKEGEDLAGLEEVSGEGKKKKRSFRRGLERKYWREKRKKEEEHKLISVLFFF